MFVAVEAGCALDSHAFVGLIRALHGFEDLYGFGEPFYINKCIDIYIYIFMHIYIYICIYLQV